MLVQGPTLRDAACIWITKYDGYTPPELFINIYIYMCICICYIYTCLLSSLFLSCGLGMSSLVYAAGHIKKSRATSRKEKGTE